MFITTNLTNACIVSDVDEEIYMRLGITEWYRKDGIDWERITSNMLRKLLEYDYQQINKRDFDTWSYP